ncbi:MAG: L-glutamate gamma-semialdehyde dehydrogenase [Clostridia bacterium]|nr:L-glutamate gamma-semialdehyde dehydrogenase [Clostridia bacterium]
MNNAFFRIDQPVNEAVNSYAPGTRARATLKEELCRQQRHCPDIPLIIGGREVFTDVRGTCSMPHIHTHTLAHYSVAGERELRLAMDAAMNAREVWAGMPWEQRASIFLKAADLLAGPWRDRINAATMLGQSKTAHQAEIDSACELIDFLRFNVYFAQEIYRQQPNNAPGIWNRMEYRPLDGFVMAISPFNFTSIGGNLCTAPAIMGNTVLWKPASTAVLSNYYFMRLLEEAGLPAGVINFIPCRGADVSRHVLTDERLAGFHFTGSTAVFSGVWSLVGENIRIYQNYPRLVGETGGKDFVFAHPTAQVEALVPALVRGAYEYQGQKCSAASRAYVPESLWPACKKRLLEEIAKLSVGDICDFRNFMGAVIDREAFGSIREYINYAARSADAEVLTGGSDDSVGYFIQPTLIHAKSPDFKTMVEEIFGPVLTVYVYPDSELEETLRHCDTVSPYALTGAVFAQDRQAILYMQEALSGAAGNFYVNDKPTGAVIGQQPFGGARASGTNDKAGSMLNLYRWVSPRVIKETFVPPQEVMYPFMGEE